MNDLRLLSDIAAGRTDRVFDLLALDNWRQLLECGDVKVLQWLVYYNDVTALKAVLRAGGSLASIDLDGELKNAAFFGHWKVCDFLISHGANVRAADPVTGETCLHNALSKAGRPSFIFVVRLLLDHDAEVNARTLAGVETSAFMRDVRTRGETPLHRAAAYADASTIEMLLAHGADREARDAQGASPLTWASEHLRPGRILSLLSYGSHRVGERSVREITSDHGAGWGDAMDWKFVGQYRLESRGCN